MKSIIIAKEGALTPNEIFFLQDCPQEMDKEYPVDIHNKLFDDNDRCILCLMGSVCISNQGVKNGVQ